MPAKPRPRSRRQAPDLETNSVPDDLRREDPPATPDSMPPRDQNQGEDGPAGGGFTPTEDGGNPQHPIHDDDVEDKTPGDYEREIDRIGVATRVALSAIWA
jgi:hypothetical protein